MRWYLFPGQEIETVIASSHLIQQLLVLLIVVEDVSMLQLVDGVHFIKGAYQVAREKALKAATQKPQFTLLTAY